MSRTNLSAILIVALTIIGFGQTGARYLIITHDTFYDDVLPLAEWKYQKGMKSKTVRLSEIGSSSVEIRNYIQNAYNNWAIKPEYLLLVGAPNFIPFPMVYGEYSDNYYTNMSGDIYNEILSGRLTVHSNYEAKTVINKILAYEKDPDISDSLWFRKAVLIVNVDYDPHDDSIYWSDAHFAAQCMVNNGFVEIDTLSDIYGHNSQTVINSVNNGRSIVMYRGVGVNNWSSPFDVNPHMCQNEKKLPIVISTTCRTIGTGSTSAMAEQWLLTGSPTQCRGGAGFFATTTVVSSQAYLRSSVAKGFHDGLFYQGMRTFGLACENGRKNVYTMWPYQGGAEEYVGFTTIGDPEMNIWTDTPEPLTVQHPPFANFGPCSIQIVVRGENDSTPISNAVVCLSGQQDSSVYIYNNTNSQGAVRLFIHPTILQDTIMITVTGFNLKPWQGKMPVLPCHSYVLYSHALINDSLSGNSNGLINPCEDIEMPLWVVNLGDSTAYRVIGTLRTADPCIFIDDSVRSFGHIAGHDSSCTGFNGFNFKIPYSIPDQYQINFELLCQDIYDSSWTSAFRQTVFSSKIGINGLTVFETNNNGIIEPGETVQVFVNLFNSGHAAADEVKTIMRSQEAIITLTDTVANYGHIGIDSSQQNTTQPFIFIVDDSASSGLLFQTRLLVGSNYAQDSFNLIFAIGTKHYYLWNPDPSPSSGMIIDSLLNSMGYAGDQGTTFPSNLLIYRSLFICLGIYSNRYLILQNSSEALAIADYLINGGRVYLEGSATWYIDPFYFNGHNFRPLFGVNATTWSYGDLGPIIGHSNAFTNGMFFNYSGENRYMDHLAATSTGFLIFSDQDNSYGCGVANTTTTYRTVGVNFELGYLSDANAPSTRAILLDSIMKFFNMHSPSIVEDNHMSLSTRASLKICPNPCINNIRFSMQSAEEIPNQKPLCIYNACGRLIIRLTPVKAGHDYIFNWDRRDISGRKVSAGVYFASLENNGNYLQNKFIVLER